MNPTFFAVWRACTLGRVIDILMTPSSPFGLVVPCEGEGEGGGGGGVASSLVISDCLVTSYPKKVFPLPPLPLLPPFSRLSEVVADSL
jgi:hypothetical protein